MKILTRITQVSLLFLVFSCGGSSDGDSGQTPQSGPIPAPRATTLVFPENNTECNEGINLNDMQSTVTFRWNATENTDSYEVNLRNLNNNTSTTAVSTVNEADITIDRGTPYEWFVVSMADGTRVTASSPTERFFNQGPGIESHPPFPAEAINPTRGANITNTGPVTLEWTGSDVDDDIINFDIFFDTQNELTTALETTNGTSFEVNIDSRQTYYWRIVTRDREGNTSQSALFTFRVN